jgi:hypothetical protein
LGEVVGVGAGFAEGAELGQGAVDGALEALFVEVEVVEGAVVVAGEHVGQGGA